MSRFVHPETTILTLANGDTLTVKKWLNEGETREAYSRMYRESTNGTSHIHPQQVGRSMVLAYLLDWSLTDDTGKQVVIREKSVEEVGAALDQLFPDEFEEIHAAIKAHEAAMLKARQEKKRPSGVPASEATSASAT